MVLSESSYGQWFGSLRIPFLLLSLLFEGCEQVGRGLI